MIYHLSNRMIPFRTVLFQNRKEFSIVNELAELLIVRHFCTIPSVPEVATGLKLFRTIPATRSKAERSFSKLQLIENHLRNGTSSLIRLASVPSIGNDKIRSLDINALVEKS